MQKRQIFIFETGLGLIGGLTIAFVVVLFVRGFSPILCSLAEEELQSRFNKIGNYSVMKYLEKQENDLNFIEVQRAENGEIQGITSDTVIINKFKSEISLDIQKELDKIDEISVKIPTGGFLGFGGGFTFPVKLMNVTILETDIISSFEAVGINQTRLSVDAKIRFSGKLLAIGKGNPVQIETKVPILMTVIVGKVPGTYIDVKK